MTMGLLAIPRRSLVVSLLVLIGLFSYEIGFLVSEAHAIPAFGRKYGLPCNVCHVPGFPKLNDFGNQFRDQGYQFDADVDLPTHPNITMGYWPLSMRTTVGYQASSVRTSPVVGTCGKSEARFALVTASAFRRFAVTLPLTEGSVWNES